MNDEGKFSPSTAEVCEPLKKANITKVWIDMEQHIPKHIWQTHKIIKKNATMEFYNEKKQLDWVSVLEWVFCNKRQDTVPNKWSIIHCTTEANSVREQNLASLEPHYSNTVREALGIFHGLEKFHCYCFVQISQCNYRPQSAGNNL